MVAELGATPAQDQVYRLTYDGSVADEANFAVMGGSADVIAEVVSRGFRSGLSLADAAKLARTRARCRRRAECRTAGAGGRGFGGRHSRPEQGNAAQVPADQGDRLAALLADGPEPASTVAAET